MGNERTLQPHTISDINSDAFRNAFVAISREAIPHFDLADAYIGDLLHDAHYAAGIPEGEVFYIVVRDVGTHIFRDAYDAMQRCESRHFGDSRAVLRVQRFRFDTFKVKLIYTRDGVVRFNTHSDATSDVSLAC